MDHPAFSIVIPTYQRRDVVCDAVRALSRVRYSGEIEIVVVVDGSTDGTAAALAKLDCPFSLRVIEQENRGLAAARNRGASEASGYILLFLDDDMICDPNIIEQHAIIYRAGADAVTGDIPLHEDSPAGILTDAVATAAVWKRSTPPSPFDICGGQLSVARPVFEALGGFDEEFNSDGKYGDEDVEFAVRLVERFDVRHNAAAISRQLNLVSARDFMRRALQLARADLQLIAKHPQVTTRLFDLRGASSRRMRSLYWPVSSIPLVPGLLAATAVRLCEISSGTRFGSSGLLARFFVAARSISYVSALRKHAGDRAARNLLRL